jgi:hypothetical protein
MAREEGYRAAGQDSSDDRVAWTAKGRFNLDVATILQIRKLVEAAAADDGDAIGRRRGARAHATAPSPTGAPTLRSTTVRRACTYGGRTMPASVMMPVT